jgi:hypothetical protein
MSLLLHNRHSVANFKYWWYLQNLRLGRVGRLTHNGDRLAEDDSVCAINGGGPLVNGGTKWLVDNAGVCLNDTPMIHPPKKTSFVWAPLRIRVKGGTGVP